MDERQELIYYGAVAMMSAVSSNPESLKKFADTCKEFNITPEEKQLLTQIFRFFTTADIDVAKGYSIGL